MGSVLPQFFNIYFTFPDKTYGYTPLQIIKCYHKTDDIMLCVDGKPF